MRVLTPEQEALLNSERRLLNDLRAVLARLGIGGEDEESLKQSIQQLEDFFLIVVVGEFNSGKSAAINALLGQRTLEEGSRPPPPRCRFFVTGRFQKKPSSAPPRLC